MATLKIREFNSCHVGYGGVVTMAQEPAVADQTVTFSTEVKSAAFNADTRFICIQPDLDCCFAIGTNPTATMSMIGVGAGEKYFTGVSPGMKISVIAGDSFFLLYDDFESNPGGVAGRIPNIGPAWNASGVDYDKMEVTGGALIQNGGTGNGIAYSNQNVVPGEIGCKFRTQADLWMGLTVLGDPSVANSALLVQIRPSGQDPAFFNVTYPCVAGDTLESVASSMAALINADANAMMYGITAVAADTTIKVYATETPGIGHDQSGGINATLAHPGAPTVACWPTGQQAAAGMVHCVAFSSGDTNWTKYIDPNGTGPGVVVFDDETIVRRFKGLRASTEYTYRCCIGSGVDAGYVWGGIWDSDGNPVSFVVGRDSAMSTYLGNSAFWETGNGGAPYTKVWCLRNSSVTLASVRAVLP